MKTKFYFLCTFILLMSASAHAQILERVLSTFSEIKNVSYNSTSINKDLFDDIYHFDTLKNLINQPKSDLSYRFIGKRSENIYDGSKLFSLQFSDSTYRISSKPESGHYYESLLYVFSRIDDFLKTGKKAIQLKDSVVNNKSYAHLKLMVMDTIVKNKPVFTHLTLLIDKKTDLLYYYRNNSKGFIDGTNTYITAFDEYRFTDYLVDATQTEDLTKQLLPAYFSLEKPKVFVPLLAKGTALPETLIYNLDGEKIQLSSFKGKVLLINFTLNGCPHCVNSIETLNAFQEKYNNTDFEIVTINHSDNKEAILKYDKRFGIKYTTYTCDATMLKKYSVPSFPLFYIVDKNGKINSAHNGFSAKIGEQMAKEVEQLLR